MERCDYRSEEERKMDEFYLELVLQFRADAICDRRLYPRLEHYKRMVDMEREDYQNS